MVVLLVEGVDELDLFVDFGRLRRMDLAADCLGPDRFHDGGVHSLEGEQHSLFEPDEGRCGPTCKPRGRTSQLTERRCQGFLESS